MLTGRYTAIPAFLGVMLLTFYLTFDVIGAASVRSAWALGIDAADRPG